VTSTVDKKSYFYNMSDSIRPSGIEGSASRMRLPGRILKSHSSELSSSSNAVADGGRLQTSQLQSSHSISECMSSESELRARKRKSFIKDVNGLCAVNSIELTDVSAICALDQRPTFKRTRGHCFISASLRSPTWCDRCGDFIWGVYKQCLICTSEFLFVVTSVQKYLLSINCLC